MRIERVELRRLEMPLVDYFETSFGREELRQVIIVGIFGEGLSGYGEVPVMEFPGYSYETVGTAWHVLRDFFIPAVLEKDWQTPEELALALTPYRGHPMAKSGLEGAFWDLYGKKVRKSLAELLGGKKKSVEVGVSIGIQENPELLLKLIAGYLGEGYRRIKVKIKPGWDLQMLETIRYHFPRIPLMADANSAYGLDDLFLFKEMEKLHLMMIEQPLGNDDLVDHARLQKELSTSLCLDESILSPDDARKAMELGSCQVINIKIGRVGGLTQAVALHDSCLRYQIPVWCGGMLETGIGRAHNLALASLPNFTLPGDTSASRRYYREDIVDHPAELNKDGTIDVPVGPGIGVNPVPAVLDRYTIVKEVFK